MGQSEEEKYLFAQGASILVVDDNDMNRKVARSLMKRNGIVPDEAASGAEAIEKIAEKTYDIVFLDHMMPKMDGIETLKRLKEAHLIPQGCAVIALTANAVSGARDRYLESGFDDYLSKPIEVAQLERKLAAWLPAGKVTWRSSGAGDEGAAVEHDAENPREESPDDIMEFEADPEEWEGFLEFAPDESSENNIEEGSMNTEALGERLRAAGIDADAALRYCGGDVGFYRELLSDYARSCPEKKAELNRCFESADWHGFEVSIHALKSTSKTIGAMNLSGKALALEEAADRSDADTIRANYPDFSQEYEKLAERIAEVMGS
jgi:CheY-like chemotaxis protein/HPt (histidine-containing phosphotransfer) domain-containing protein